ncbi:MAG: hypothetical protein ACREHV_07865 [Rhizomicrobium sp.]
MGDYRVYLLDSGGRIVSVRELQAENDTAILKVAKQYSASQNVEVWQRARLVGTLPLDGAATLAMTARTGTTRF